MALSLKSASWREIRDIYLGLSEDGRSCEFWSGWRSRIGRSCRGSGFGFGSAFVLLAAFIFLSLAVVGALASEGVSLPSTDLSVASEGVPDPVVAGEVSTFVFTVRNDGPDDATGVLVNERLTMPEGVTLISAITTRGVYDPETSVWTVGSLPVGGVETLTFGLDVSSSVLSGTVISSSAKVAGNEVDRDLGDNEASEDTVVTTDAQLAVAVKCWDLKGEVGDRPVYTVEMTNNGPSDAREVWFKELLPPVMWLKNARYSDDDGASDEAWIGFLAIGDMAPGETKTILIYGDVDLASPSANGGVTVTVSWMDTIDPVCNSEVFSCGADSCFGCGQHQP
jgi:uncharacterized repeat protein (TIGR01451 family)